MWKISGERLELVLPAEWVRRTITQPVRSVKENLGG